MNESSLSFISSLSSGKDDDSIILSDAVNAGTSFNTEIRIKNEMVNSELINISFDKSNLSSENAETTASPVTTVDPISNLTQFSILNDSGLAKSNVQSSVCNFITTMSPGKSVELPSVKTGITNSNKANSAQLLIFQKPTTNIPMIVGKGVPVASASNVAIVQPSTVVSSGTKILTLPTLNTSGNLINAVAPSGSGKTGDVKILLSSMPCATSVVSTKPIISTSSINSNLQGPLKRAVTPSSTGQMITKVIITNNASSNQTLVSPVPVSASGTTPITVTQPQSILLTSPNKTFTFPRNVLNLSGSQQIIRALPGTPTKQVTLSLLLIL